MTTRIVAVDGKGGAGKSTFAARLAAELDDAEIVRTDDFASWDNPFDWWPELIEKVLVPLSRNKPVPPFERSHWEPGQQPEQVHLRRTDFIVLEGVTASRDAFRGYLTYAIWVETPRDVRLERGLERDGEHALPQWEAWMEGEEQYRLREHPDTRADFVVRGDRDDWR